MAHLKDLIVTGVSRFLGTVYAKLFKGDLEGTATKATNDSAGNKITSTYIKDISGGGVNSLTITKGDGSNSNVTMSMEPRVVNLGDQETSTRSCVTSFGQGITIYACSNWTDKPAGAPDAQGTLITVAYNNTSNEMGTRWVWAHQYFMSPFVTYPWVRMGSSEVLTEWTPINRADIPSSNPNLLINPDFKINQRGITSGTFSSDTFTCDRWRLQTNGNIAYSSSANSLSCSVDADHYANMIQTIDLNDIPYLYGKTVTFSANVKSYSGSVSVRIHQGSTYANVAYDARNMINTTGLNTISYSIQNDTTNHYLNIVMCMDYYVASSFDIEWVKLEVGSVATQFVPPDSATELMKCQRYYYRSGLISFDKTTLNPHYAVFKVNFPVSMYRIPTVTLYSANGTANTISTWADRVDSIGSVYINAPDLCTESFSSITSNNEFTLNQSYSFYYIADAGII